MIDTPECDRQHAVQADAETLSAFLDWLTANGIHLAYWEDTKPCDHTTGASVTPGQGYPTIEGVRASRKWRCVNGRLIGHPDSNAPGVDGGECPNCEGTGRVERVEPRLVPQPGSFNQLLARYFGIDLDKVEAERRQVLDALTRGELP